MLQKFLATTMSMLLISCSATQQVSTAHPRPTGLSRFVLIIQAPPEGEIAHSWQPIESFEISPYRHQLRTESFTRSIVPAVARPRDCDQENQEYYRKCMQRPLPRSYGSIKVPRKSGGKSEFCREECRQAYEDCVELERLRPQEFTATDGAVDWLKRHRNEVMLGSVIVIAGVAFVVISAGAGLLILAPAVLLASLESQPMLPAREATR